MSLESLSDRFKADLEANHPSVVSSLLRRTDTATFVAVEHEASARARTYADRASPRVYLLDLRGSEAVSSLVTVDPSRFKYLNSDVLAEIRYSAVLSKVFFKWDETPIVEEEDCYDGEDIWQLHEGIRLSISLLQARQVLAKPFNLQDAPLPIRGYEVVSLEHLAARRLTKDEDQQRELESLPLSELLMLCDNFQLAMPLIGKVPTSWLRLVVGASADS
ncbi:hypothetical protein [Curtobacterium flaccumfaciens]|uniref:hypothetical protein n=1 Tax=Curtobacterium flaccumfaciens TaxID=2035 RepID=UPI00387A8223